MDNNKDEKKLNISEELATIDLLITDEKSEENSEENSEEKFEEKKAADELDNSVDKSLEDSSEEKSVEEKEEQKEDKKEAEKEEQKEDKKEAEKEEQKEDKKESEKEDKKDDKSEFYIKEPFIDTSVYERKRQKRVTKIVVASVLSFFLLVYFGGVIYFSYHFNTMTRINGKDVSGKSVSDVESMLMTEAKQYQLTVAFKDMDYVVKLGDGGTSVALTVPVKELAHKRSPFLWVADIFYAYKYDCPYTVNYDETELKSYLDQCSAMDESRMEAPVDAKVVMENGEAVVIPEKIGTKLDKNVLYDKVKYALKTFETRLDAVKEGCYVVAHITTESDVIIQAKENADKYLDMKACYDFGGYKYQIPREELSTMAYISQDGTVKISKNNVEGYAKRFAKQFTTTDSDRVFTTHDHKKFLIYGKEYGWVIDSEAEAEELYEYMIKKKDFVKEPSCTHKGYAMCEDNDIGDSYVEVDLTNQHVYVYVDGYLKLDTDCVTGHTPGHTTPGGLYGITYMKLHAILRGEDYETPVTYWMPFNRGIGLHDANWRAKFGGDIYTRDGSHGCVNLPPAKAAEVFELVEPGFPVVCYWRDEVEEVK